MNSTQHELPLFPSRVPVFLSSGYLDSHLSCGNVEVRGSFAVGDEDALVDYFPPQSPSAFAAVNAVAKSSSTCYQTHPHYQSYAENVFSSYPEAQQPTYDIGLCSPPIDVTDFSQYESSTALAWTGGSAESMPHRNGTQGTERKCHSTSSTSAYQNWDHSNHVRQQALHSSHPGSMSAPITASDILSVADHRLDGLATSCGMNPTTMRPMSETQGTYTEFVRSGPALSHLSFVPHSGIPASLVSPQPSPPKEATQATRTGDMRLPLSPTSPAASPWSPSWSKALHHDQHIDKHANIRRAAAECKTEDDQYDQYDQDGLSAKPRSPAETAPAPLAAASTARTSRPRGSNREAAKKCRERMKVNEQKLGEREREVVLKNDELKGELSRVEAEVNALRDRVLAHAHCHDPNISRWISCRASEISDKHHPLMAAPSPASLPLTGMRPLKLDPVNGRLDFRLLRPPPPAAR